MNENLISSLIDKVEGLCEEIKQIRSLIEMQSADMNEMREILMEHTEDIDRCEHQIDGIKTLMQ